MPHAHALLRSAHRALAITPSQVIRMVGESQEAVGAGVGSSTAGSNKMPTLQEYGTNLTQQAAEVGHVQGQQGARWCLHAD